eukprot:614702-Rhodomonas_salina.1
MLLPRWYAVVCTEIGYAATSFDAPWHKKGEVGPYAPTRPYAMSGIDIANTDMSYALPTDIRNGTEIRVHWYQEVIVTRMMNAALAYGYEYGSLPRV